VEIAKKHNLKVIENCALSCGTKFKDRYIGTWGDLGIYSMQIVKVITAGEGGVVVSSDPALYERAVRYHDIGGYREKTRLTGVTGTEDEFLGENFRISELTGAVALKQLEKLDRITGSLRAIYKRYREGIEAIPGLTVQPVNDPLGALATRWGLLFEDKDTCTRFSGLLRDKGLSPGLMYGGNPIYMQPKILNQVMHTPEANPWTSPAYKGTTRSYHAGQCPRSEDIMNRVLMVASVNPLYTEHDVDGILSIVREAAGFL
jgi:8-amino-3,8-dideoxy-alpha-D-manno-octulosonate transaminase